MRQPYYLEHLQYIAAVTEALNKLPECRDLYVHVELREDTSHRPIGEWSDEIAPDAWSYSEKESS